MTHHTTTSPHLAPTSPQPAGATSLGDLAPTPLPLRGGAMSRGDLNTTNNNTTSPQPPGATSTPPHIATCQHCHRPIRHGQPYTGRIPFIGSRGGLVHQHCPPRLVVVS